MLGDFQIETGETDIFFLGAQNFQFMDAEVSENSGAGAGQTPVRFFQIFVSMRNAVIFQLIAVDQFHKGFVILAMPQDDQNAPAGAPRSRPVGALGGVRLGQDYPLPVVDPKGSRDEALRRFAALKERS